MNCTDGDVQLVGGANATLGRVEVCINNAWGAVCNSRFGTNDATVVCRQLGFSDTGAVAIRDSISSFGANSGPIFLDRITCTGSENKLFDCPQSPLGIFECERNDIVGVQCIGKYTYTQRISNISLSCICYNDSLHEVYYCVTHLQ